MFDEIVPGNPNFALDPINNDPKQKLLDFLTGAVTVASAKNPAAGLAFFKDQLEKDRAQRLAGFGAIGFQSGLQGQNMPPEQVTRQRSFLGGALQDLGILSPPKPEPIAADELSAWQLGRLRSGEMKNREDLLKLEQEKLRSGTSMEWASMMLKNFGSAAVPEINKIYPNLKIPESVVSLADQTIKLKREEIATHTALLKERNATQRAYYDALKEKLEKGANTPTDKLKQLSAVNQYVIRAMQPTFVNLLELRKEMRAVMLDPLMPEEAKKARIAKLGKEIDIKSKTAKRDYTNFLKKYGADYGFDDQLINYGADMLINPYMDLENTELDTEGSTLPGDETIDELG